MLRILSIQNYHSVLAEQTLDLYVAKNATDPDHRFARPIPDSPDRFPRVVVIFGANASGKTTVLRSIQFLQTFALYSADWPRDYAIPFLNFLSDEGRMTPTRFAVELDGELMESVGRQKFFYEVEFGQELALINKEALYYFPEGRKRKLFVREEETIDAGTDFKLSKKDPIRDKLRTNASVISTLAKFNHPFSLAIYENLRSVQTNVPHLHKQELSTDIATNYYHSNDECLSEFKKIIQKFDFGIDDLRFEPDGEEMSTYVSHSGLVSDLKLEFESQGTIGIYKLFPRIWFALQSGSVVALDELDNDIHPLLLPEIVGLFQNPETNPNDAQLIMSCHNATLLEHLTKEEIFFTEKDADGSTNIFGLSEIQGVRRDANLYAKYLAGVFGAVPKLA